MESKELSKILEKVFTIIFSVGMVIGGISMFLIIYFRGGICIN